MNEQDYLDGSKRAWLTMLSLCLRQLGYDDSEARKVAWVSEREEAILMLRRVCRDHGDNDWPDTLHLADIIDKHLAEWLPEVQSSEPKE